MKTFLAFPLALAMGLFASAVAPRPAMASSALAQLCTSDSQCPTGYVCRSGVCVKPASGGGAAVPVEQAPVCAAPPAAP